MDKMGKFYQDYTGTSFETIKLQRQQNGHSWSIVGFLASGDFKVLGVLEKPISYSLMVEFAKKVANDFNADFKEV